MAVTGLLLVLAGIMMFLRAGKVNENYASTKTIMLGLILVMVGLISLYYANPLL